MTEVEAILNSRPLTYLSSTDLQEVLTPHFLIGRRVLSIPDGAKIMRMILNLMYPQQILRKR